ncbi:NADH:ubiquinone oxidoreductase 6.6kD subunit [Biscogniauxia marginata]|nr:NADH:ubiquinone oxidoreductase 6.6kD subunit [Biscogniauxia marginata]
MGGLEHYRVAIDPAIQKLASTNLNRHKYFRWTPRTSVFNFVLLVAVPGVLGLVAYQTDGKWQFRAKRKGDLISEY